MVVREFVVNGVRLDLNYSPDFYRQVAELAGQAATPKTVVAVVRANKSLFGQRVRIELVKEDLRTFRFVPVASELFLVIDRHWISFKECFKCAKCGNFFLTREQAIGCACQKLLTPKNKTK